MSVAAAQAFSEFKLSLGSEARFYTIRVTLVSGNFENDWPLETSSFLPDVLLLCSGGRACLIPAERIDKIFITDNRIRNLDHG